MAADGARHDAALTRAMGGFFAFGSLCFVAGPLAVAGYADGSPGCANCATCRAR